MVTGRGFFFGPVTRYEFHLLTPLFELRHVVAGSFLGRRWESEQPRVNLHHLDDGGRGFFIEVGYDEALVEWQVLRSFRSAVPLADYLHGVMLPQSWV